jgi:parallel beta-helix repeat protein
MKTNFNHIGSPVALAAVALINLLLNPAALAQSVKSSAEPVVIMLSAGVTGAEVQRALNDLPSAGGEVILPAGEISIRQPLVLSRDSQTLRGAGASTILRLADDANCPVIIMGEPVNHPQHVVRNLCVRDLFIDGNRSHQQRELWKLEGEGSYIHNNGITVQAVSDCAVIQVVSARCRSGGLVTTLGVQNLTVCGLEAFDNEFDGLACYLTTNSLFADLYLHDNPGAGISLDLAFNHNVISNAVLNSNDLGIFMRASRNNQFLNVSIQDSHNFGVFMAHTEEATPSGVQPAPLTECAHNAFTNLIAANCGNAAFRVNNSTCTNNIIIRPKFDQNLKGGLSLAQPNLVTVR